MVRDEAIMSLFPLMLLAMHDVYDSSLRIMTLIGFGGACFGVTLMAIVGCLNYESPQLGAVLVFAGVSANFFNTIQSSTSYAYLTEMPEERFRARATGWGLAYCNLCVAFVFLLARYSQY